MKPAELHVQSIACDRTHCREILEILNHEIVSGTAVWDYEPRTLSAVEHWFDQRHATGHPVLGVFGAEGQLLGFASYGPFRAWAAYHCSAEHSVYVARTARRCGVGATLLRALIAHARDAGLRTLVAGIAADNRGSILLHERLGFAHCGTLRQVGHKFDTWLDLSFYQLLLADERGPEGAA